MATPTDGARLITPDHSVAAAGGCGSLPALACAHALRITHPRDRRRPDALLRGRARRRRRAAAAVVVVQEAFGVNHHIEDVTRRFAAAGYHAVAPDFFHRAGGGTVATTGTATR